RARVLRPRSGFLRAERRANDAVLLAQVRRRIALARRRAPRAADVDERHLPRLRLLEPVPDGAPGAHVLRLLLRPDDLFESRVRAQQLGSRGDRERVELLEPRDGYLLGRRTLLVPGNVVVELPRGEHQPRHALAIGAAIVEDGPERARGE